MKKITFYMMMLAISLCSCGGSDDDNAETNTNTQPTSFTNVSSIIGTWTSNGQINEADLSKSNLTDADLYKISSKLIFASDGSYEHDWDVYQSKGTYTFSNGVATCTHYDSLGKTKYIETIKFEFYSQYRTKVTWTYKDDYSDKTITKVYLFYKK
jgi:hypothetical protein